jgi:hypothetical protein
MTTNATEFLNPVKPTDRLLTILRTDWQYD